MSLSRSECHCRKAADCRLDEEPSYQVESEVRAVLRKYDLPFEDRDIINNPDNYQEMVAKQGRCCSRPLEINGRSSPT